MKTEDVYTRKAEIYHRYRWDYAPQAVEAIFEIAGLSLESVIADLGAGTGILTRHFIGRVGQIYAIEPNPAMRYIAGHMLSGPGCQVLAATAEATGLPSHSIDLISTAQAIHWFQPKPARQEFRRILKPEGWLAILRNRDTNQALLEALKKITTPENGVARENLPALPEQVPVEYYFGETFYEHRVFPITFSQDWEAFFGALVSASYMPNAGQPGFERMKTAAKQVFEQFSQGGELRMNGETELMIGRLSPHSPGLER